MATTMSCEVELPMERPTLTYDCTVGWYTGALNHILLKFTRLYCWKRFHPRTCFAIWARTKEFFKKMGFLLLVLSLFTNQLQYTRNLIKTFECFETFWNINETFLYYCIPKRMDLVNPNAYSCSNKCLIEFQYWFNPLDCYGCHTIKTTLKGYDNTYVGRVEEIRYLEN